MLTKEESGKHYARANDNEKSILNGMTITILLMCAFPTDSYSPEGSI